MAHDHGDLAAFSLANQNLLGAFEDVDYTIEETQVDGSSLLRAGAAPNGTKLAAKITTNLLSTTVAPDRVSHLDLSAMSLGGTSYLGSLRNLELSGSFVQKAKAGVGAWFKRPQNTDKDYKSSVELDCDDGVATALMASMHSTNPALRNTTLLFTLNGVAVTIPMRLQQIQTGARRQDIQTLKLTLNGRDPGTGAYPTTPTGTTTLLEKAMNAWKDPLGFAYQSHATAGFAVAGQMIYSSFSMKVGDEELVKVSYSFDSHGTVVPSTTLS